MSVTQTKLEYEVIEDRKYPGDWRVEAINRDGDGEVFVAIFSGPNADARAAEYAAWKNSGR
jgi:hypothetical protein